jgi:hypothetical protein
VTCSVFLFDNGKPLKNSWSVTTDNGANTSDEDAIKIVPGHGGVFKITCGDHVLRFQCPYHHGSTTIPGHIELRISQLPNEHLVEQYLHRAQDSQHGLVIAVDNAEVDMADLSDVATRARGLGVPLVVRHDD